MMRIGSLISNANRSIEVFKQLNDTLETLYTLETGVVPQRCMPVNFAFFTKEFTRFAQEALTNREVAQVLRELYESMERVPVKDNVVSCQQPRRSIVDPDIIKMMGPRKTSTSSKVDRRAPVQRRKMVEDFQVNVLDRKKKLQGQKGNTNVQYATKRDTTHKRAVMFLHLKTASEPTSFSNGSLKRTERESI